jgi:hypothetical protein
MLPFILTVIAIKCQMVHLNIILGVKVYYGPFKYRPACTIPSLSHRQLMGLSAPSTGKSRRSLPAQTDKNAKIY